MKRIVAIAAGVYVAAALLARLEERAGRIRCECLPDCWCKRPGLSLFRWVFPYGHSLPQQEATRS